MLARPGNGESFFVKQFLNAQNAFNVLAAIHSLAGAALNRLELWELGLPKAQHIRRQMAKRGNFSDAKIKALGNFHFRVLFGFGHDAYSCQLLNCTSSEAAPTPSSRFYHHAASETTGFFEIR